MTRKVEAITPRTDSEWPEDHPLRRRVQVADGNANPTLEVDGARVPAQYIICSFKGAVRIGAAKDDHDVDAVCGCGAALRKRASAAAHLTPICMTCWAAM